LQSALSEDNDDIKKVDNIRNFNPFGTRSNEKLVLDPANKWPKVI
jgi:hypothetical protein